MPHLRVLSIFGTRPEAVKMAPVILELGRNPGVESLVCVTAQHRQMLDQIIDSFGITPDVDLNLMQPNQTLAKLTAAIFTHLDPVLTNLKPDWVLIQGDTTTVMATALLSYYQRIRVGHVEAGLRTGNKWQPFPEEINRRVVSAVADIHFAPTELARQNLLKEGVPPKKVFVTGNPVIDALQAVAAQPYDLESGPLAGLPWDRRIVLVTAHRRENFGAPLENICAALIELAQTYRDNLCIVYPVHHNPNVQGTVHRLLSGIPNIVLLPPLDYLPLVQLLKRSSLVLTDSGGIQEEAPSLGKPVLVLREVTERPEGLQAGTAKLVGTDSTSIVRETCRLLDDPQAYAAMAQVANPYGDGQAARRIVQAILNTH